MANRMLICTGEGTYEEDILEEKKRTRSKALVNTQEKQESSDRQDFMRRLKVYRKEYIDTVKKDIIRKRNGKKPEDKFCEKYIQKWAKEMDALNLKKKKERSWSIEY